MNGSRGQSALSDSDFSTLVRDAKARHLLSDIVGRHTDLKKRGASEQVGLCPFHNERTPSFEVNDGKGQYHCHGCGKSGDAITFLMEREGMTFRAAYEILSGDEFPTISAEDRAKRIAEDEGIVRARIGLARSFWSKGVATEGTLPRPMPAPGASQRRCLRPSASPRSRALSTSRPAKSAGNIRR